MTLIDKETIRKEIERRFWDYGTPLHDDEVTKKVDEILDFLDTLQEQPVIKKSNALFDKCVENCEPAVMKEVSDNIDKMLARQPVTDCHELDSEIFAWQKAHANEDTAQVIAMTARHFAEWGAEYAKK